MPRVRPMLKLGIDEAALIAANGLHTANEIAQQPMMLKATHALLVAQQAELEAFLAPILSDPNARIILTGAGTSAFIGECLGPVLNRQIAAHVEAVATTDIVSTPYLWLEAATRTLLVSFARSGNSPESTAAVELANQMVDDVRHLIITCNEEGSLAKNAGVNAYTVLLPPETHDRSFAMTSSFTSMTYAALAALAGIDNMAERIGNIVRATSAVIESASQDMKHMAEAGFDRVVYLGSGPLQGLAREAALKLMELTDGRVVTAFDTPLGFRHGPKTIVTDKTLVMIFLSNHPVTRAYDLDLVNELQRDGKAGGVVTLSAQPDDGGTINVAHLQSANDVDLLFPYIAIPQMFAFYASLCHGLMPDNPNVTGTVNRVVQGVRIHMAVNA
jgi:tagatose-6-phosphate ketose/aldose isomerase